MPPPPPPPPPPQQQQRQPQQPPPAARRDEPANRIPALSPPAAAAAAAAASPSAASASARLPAFARAHPLLNEALVLLIQSTPLLILLTVLSTRRALRVPRWQSVLLYYAGLAGYLGRYLLFILSLWWAW